MSWHAPSRLTVDGRPPGPVRYRLLTLATATRTDRMIG